MPKETLKSKVTWKQGCVVEAESRGFKITLDEPKEAGGTNTGMNPVEMLLGSLGACQMIAGAMIAPKMGIQLEEFWVELEGELNTDGFMGIDPNVRAGYQNIRFNFHIKADITEDKAAKFVHTIESICPVGDSINNGVPFDPAKITLE
jgi:uncharacterized OsmC-like protein